MEQAKKLKHSVLDVYGNEISTAKLKFGKRLRKSFRENWQLYSLLVLPLIWVIVFQYLPMAGNAIAFRRFIIGGSIFGETFVGMHFFRMFWEDPGFWNAFWNTVILGVLTLLFTFPAPIIIALMLNEVKSKKFKKITQTLSYLPHFLSIPIVVGIIFQLTRAAGPINNIIYAFGGERIIFMMETGWFRTIFVTSRVWQTAGWGTILYLAALTNIDPTLYEAAKIDGANRWKQTWHVTLPGIRPTIIVLLILNVGWVLGVNFEQVFMMENALIRSTADIIGTYVFRVGIGNAQWSFATAAGMFQALVGVVLLTITNFISRKLTESSLW